MVSSEMPETHVLAIASHVTSGYVGNTMATFCMQTLGCEVSAIHTVNYSNHVGYKRFHGRKSTAAEVEDLFTGLQQTHLDDVQVMLSGYCPSAELVQQVGKIARSIKLKATMKPGSFFWVLDPVMGDNGRLYVEEATLPAYRSLLQDADLILPNQFEAESLSDVKIHDLHSMQEAVTKLHQVYQIPHIIITSIRLPPTTSNTPLQMDEDLTTTAKISIIGSTRTSDMKPRLFRITVPAFPIFFSGTGDMFAALMVARLREAAHDADVLQQPSWRSADDVVSTELPLAKAAEKVLASMHAVLKDTADYYDEQSRMWNEERREASTHGEESHKDIDMQKHLRLTRAAEVRVVRNTRALLFAPDLDKFKAQAIDLDGDIEVEQPEPKGHEARQVGLELIQQQS